MYTINDLSQITGISELVLRDRANTRKIVAHIQGGIKYFSKNSAVLLCNYILDEEYSELLFEDFLNSNSPISIQEAKKALLIDENYEFKQREYVYQSRLNFFSLKDL